MLGIFTVNPAFVIKAFIRCSKYSLALTKNISFRINLGSSSHKLQTPIIIQCLKFNTELA